MDARRVLVQLRRRWQTFSVPRFVMVLALCTPVSLAVGKYVRSAPRVDSSAAPPGVVRAPSSLPISPAPIPVVRVAAAPSVSADIEAEESSVREAPVPPKCRDCSGPQLPEPGIVQPALPEVPQVPLTLPPLPVAPATAPAEIGLTAGSADKKTEAPESPKAVPPLKAEEKPAPAAPEPKVPLPAEPAVEISAPSKVDNPEPKKLVELPTPAADVKEPQERLEHDLNQLFPNSHVRLKRLGEAVLVTGQAADAREATQLLHIVVANTPWAVSYPPGTSDAAHYLPSGSPNVINMLKVAGAAPVMLNVAVVEMSHAAAHTLYGRGAASGDIAVATHARSVHAARSLVDPKVILLHGQPATLLGGGQFPVNAGRAAGEAPAITLAVAGMQVVLTPLAGERDHVRVKVSMNGEKSATGAPSTYVADLREGQMFALPAAVQPSAAVREGQPLFGRLPWVGRLTGSEYTAGGDQEVVLIIEPDFASAR